MAIARKYIDLAVGESGGNGGDLQLLGNDLAMIYGYENQTYLALFGGNVEEDTKIVKNKNIERFSYWANNLLFGNDQSKQYNSKTERTLNNVALNSSGRLSIEIAVKQDLKYLSDLGATVTVDVKLIAVNTVKINITTIYSNGVKSITVITFSRPTVNADFSFLDFNEDFFI